MRKYTKSVRNACRPEGSVNVEETLQGMNNVTSNINTRVKSSDESLRKAKRLLQATLVIRLPTNRKCQQ